MENQRGKQGWNRKGELVWDRRGERLWDWKGKKDEQGWDQKSCVSIFVNNLLERMHWRWLRQPFRYHGRVIVYRCAYT